MQVQELVYFQECNIEPPPSFHMGRYVAQEKLPPQQSPCEHKPPTEN